MYLDYYDLIPNVGIKDIKIGMTLKDVEDILKKKNILYEISVNKHERGDKVPWIYIEIKDYMDFIFTKDVLWRISAFSNFKGKLSNGIKLGMKLDECKKIDKSLEFDDWDELFFSKNNYIIEDECEFNTIITIMIGIEELFDKDDELFYSYEWTKQYKK